jgi:hypothetical protein
MQAEAGFYQAPNVSILVHLLGSGQGRPFPVRNRMLGQISTEYRAPMGRARCLQLYDQPNCTGPSAKTLIDADFPCLSPPCTWPRGDADAKWVDPGKVLQRPSNQINSQYYTPQFGIGGVEFSPDDLFEAVSMQRWTGLIFSNADHTTMGMPHMTGDKWSITRGFGGAAIQIAQKCATCMYGGPDPHGNFTEHTVGPVIDIVEASAVATVGAWVVVTATNASHQDGYGAVRPVRGDSTLANHSAMVASTANFFGQVLMEEEFTPLILVAGTQAEFGGVENFTQALGQLGERNAALAPLS